MTSRNMTIREDVYCRLSEAKREGESFSDVIERLLEKKSSLMPLWRALSSSNALREIEKEAQRIRKSATIMS